MSPVKPTADRRWSRKVRPLALMVAVAGLALTGVLSWASFTANHNNNSRLLELQVRQAASALGTSATTIGPELTDGLELLSRSHSTEVFRSFAQSKIGVSGVVSISLWRKTASGAQLVADVGMTPRIATSPAAHQFFVGVRPSTTIFITPMLGRRLRRLGFAVMAPGKSTRFAYAEISLPSSEHLRIPKSSAYNDLNFAIYLGKSTRLADLIEASIPTPIRGLHATASTPFGNTFLTLVASPTIQLTGALSGALGWIVLVVGGVLTLTSATTVEYVARRRQLAEDLAAENERLYRGQRDIAATLQQALLPDIPTLPGIRIAARYLPGVADMEVGGDWYDVIPVSDHRLVFVVGDVSGRGLRAATTMGGLRYATRAYVAQGDDPPTVLSKLGKLIDFDTDHQFATVVIGEVDVPGRRIRLSSAGHLLPLLISQEGETFVDVPIAPPVGLVGSRPIALVSLTVPEGATFLAFTDGLVERRGESLDVGLERLRQATTTVTGPVDQVLDRLLNAVLPHGGEDDAAILGLQWTS